MAIYHFSVQVISRGKGQSAVASASYRSGEKLRDEQSEQTKYYKREVQPENHILAPSHAPSWVQNREFLWNEVERSETRKNSRLAREINIALPRELSNEQQTELIKGYVQEQFVDKGMIADIAIHRDDKENPHAHVMLTTREISEDGFTTKNRDWNNKELLEQWREQWSEHANKALEKENIQERITHKSHADRGLEILPTVHLGHVASDMEKKGIETDRGNINREVKQHNAIIYDLQKYREEKRQLEEQLKQKTVSFTPKEQKILSAAEQFTQKYFNKKVTIDSIKQVKEVLNETEKQYNSQLKDINNQKQNLDKLIQKESYLSNLEKQLVEKEQTLANTGLFKLKEKDNLRKEIEPLKSMIAEERNNLSILMKDNQISTREEIPFKVKQKEREFEKALSEIESDKKMVVGTKAVFKESEKILKDYEIRKATALYPELQGKEIGYKTALELNKYHEHISKISDISSIVKNDKAKMSDLTNDISSFDKRVETLVLAEQKLQEADELLVKIKAIQDNPYLHGKSLHDPTGKEEYEKLVASRKAITKELVEMNYGSRNGILADRELVDEQKPKHEQNMKQLEELKEKTKALTNIQRDIQRAEKQQEHTITR